MIKGLSEILESWKDTTYYFFVEKFSGEVVLEEGFYEDVTSLDVPGFQVGDYKYLGNGIMRIVLIED